MTASFDLPHIAFYGRVADEALAMFDLDWAALAGKRVLDCPTGPSSLVAEAHARGVDMVGCDPIYAEGVDALRARGLADIEVVVARVEAHREKWDWAHYGDLEALRRKRAAALERFLADLAAGLPTGRYVTAALPHLPFPDGHFDLVLNGHLLFSYSARFSDTFLLDSLRELVRVSAGEVRVYPIQPFHLPAYVRDPRFGQLQAALEAEGVHWQVRKVPFQAQKGTDEMLVLRGP